MRLPTGRGRTLVYFQTEWGQATSARGRLRGTGCRPRSGTTRSDYFPTNLLLRGKGRSRTETLPVNPLSVPTGDPDYPLGPNRNTCAYTRPTDWGGREVPEGRYPCGGPLSDGSAPPGVVGDRKELSNSGHLKE